MVMYGNSDRHNGHYSKWIGDNFYFMYSLLISQYVVYLDAFTIKGKGQLNLTDGYD
jgi:hypothetical protein